MRDHDAGLDETKESDRDDDVFDLAMQRFDDAVLPQLEVRTLALSARRFASIPGAQWEDDTWHDQFANAIRMEINKIGRAIRKLKNDYRQNRIVPDFRPAGGDSDNDTADTLDGLHRADSYHFKAQQARDNAFDEAAAGGFGAYRLTTEYADPLDKDNDEQRINPGLIIADADQCVFFDPDSKLYDKSDARFCFVLTQLSPDAFTRQWGDKAAVSFPDGVTRQYDWFRPDTVIQAEYYLIEEVTDTLLVYTLEASGEEQRFWADEIDAEGRATLKAMGWTKRQQKRDRRRCRKYVLSGAEILADQGHIPGGNIPVVPVYCYRDFIDGVERFKGIVQDKMDAQRRYNASISKLAEIDALAPYERPIFDPEQIPPNLQNGWARANIDRHPYALAMALRNEDGTIAALGPIGKVDPPRVPETTAALLQASNTDLTEDDEDVDQVVANTSADAMDLAAARVDAKSGFMLDNMRQSVQREGELYLDMAREIYVEDERTVPTMTEDGDDGAAVLNEPYRDGEILKVRNNFSTGGYKVIASVTEATATRRDRTVKSSINLAEMAIKAQNLTLANAALLTAAANMDGEGIADLHRLVRKESLKIELVEPTEDEQRARQEAAENAPPDPTQQIAEAQTQALQAGAQKDMAQAGKLVADTELSKAKVVETLASAADKRVQAGLRPVEAANDAVPPEPRIRTGRELAQ